MLPSSIVTLPSISYAIYTGFYTSPSTFIYISDYEAFCSEGKDHTLLSQLSWSRASLSLHLNDSVSISISSTSSTGTNFYFY